MQHTSLTTDTTFTEFSTTTNKNGEPLQFVMVFPKENPPTYPDDCLAMLHHTGLISLDEA